MNQNARQVTSRERVRAALNHESPDRTPVDFGATGITGISASFIYKLRRELGLPEKPIKIFCPYQMLGEVDAELRDYLGVDVVGLWPEKNLFGFDNNCTKSFMLPDGTPVLVSEQFNTDYEPDGRLFQYARGDRSHPPSAVMPAGGWYFDTVIRQTPIDEDKLNPEDNLQESPLLTEADLRGTQDAISMLYANTDYALIGGTAATALGDIALVPGPMLPEPKGIRDIEEWYMSLVLRPDYVREVFAQQTERALSNLKLYYEAVGNKIEVMVLCGTDFGSQHTLMCSVEVFRTLFLPFYKQMNDWVHANTRWKTFKHSCGAVEPLIEGFIEAGFDILNPVQCSAVGMDARTLKDKYGGRITFWGGGVDTQGTLQSGTPDDVRREVKERLSVFGPGGGFVFNTIHNTQANVPVENFLAMIETLRNFR